MVARKRTTFRLKDEVIWGRTFHFLIKNTGCLVDTKKEVCVRAVITAIDNLANLYHHCFFGKKVYILCIQNGGAWRLRACGKLLLTITLLLI